MQKKGLVIFCIGGVVGALFLGVMSLAMGWVVSSGRAQVSAAEMSDKAVQMQLAKICHFQFNAESDRASMFTKMKSLNDWEREKYVEDHGWAKMPGSDSSVTGVARACAVTITKAAS